MSHVATNSNVARLAETHMRLAFMEALKATGSSQYTEMEGGGFVLITGCPHPLGNLSIGPSDPQAAAKQLADSGYPSAILVFGSDDPTAEEGLAHYGFQQGEPLPAMAVDIAQMNASPCPEGYEFYRLTSSSDTSRWSRAFADGYGIPFELADLFSPARMDLQDNMQFFEARKGDEVVAVSCMVLAEGVAGIYCVATLPDHRGKGLGALLTAEPLRQAQGYKTGVLQASTMGYPIYRKLGFQDVGSLRMHVRIPGA